MESSGWKLDTFESKALLKELKVSFADELCAGRTYNVGGTSLQAGATMISVKEAERAFMLDTAIGMLGSSH